MENGEWKVRCERLEVRGERIEVRPKTSLLGPFTIFRRFDFFGGVRFHQSKWELSPPRSGFLRFFFSLALAASICAADLAGGGGLIDKEIR